MSTAHPICTREEWNAARKELLTEEKKFTRLRDQLSEKRRALPWVRIERDYVFHGTEGPRSLRDLFGDKTQLLIYHFMFAPEWEAGCKSCSFWGDHFDEETRVHLAQRDVRFAAVSRAPVQNLSAYAKRMGWSFTWVSSEGSTFNYDYLVSFSEEQRSSQKAIYNFATQRAHNSDLPGISVFCRDDRGNVFHTYSCYSRGIDMVNTTYQLLDLVPKGRDEAGANMAWLRRRDEYPEQA